METVRPGTGSSRRVRATIATAAAVIIGGAWQISDVLKQSVISVPMVEPVKTAQIYYFDGGYTEDESSIVRSDSMLDRGGVETELRFRAGDRFRLDLIGDGTVQFGNTLTTERLGFLHKRVRTYSFDITRLAVHDISAAAEGRIAFSSKADPYIDVDLAQLPVVTDRVLWSGALPVFIAVLAGLPILVYRWYGMLRRHYLLALAAVALCCFLAMIAISLPVHHGPDETLHIASGRWYVTRLLPPSMVDPEVYYDSYFGVNYIIGHTDLTYLVTFKAAGIIDSIAGVPLHVGARLAQIAIFAALFFVLLRFAGPLPAMTLLLAVAALPEAAYLLTYVNGDALSFCFGVAALIVLAVSKAPNKWVVALVFFTLMNLKTHYALLLPAAALLLYRASRFRYAPWAAVGCAVGLYRYAFNVFDQARTHLTFAANQALHAGPIMRDRVAHGFWDPTRMIGTHFYISSAKSLYAIFGQMNFVFNPGVYVAGVVLAFVLLWRNGWRVNLLIAAAMVVNLAASLWYSMTYAYQPQGRYLLPAVVIAIAVSAERCGWRRVAPFALVTMFCLMRFVQTAG